MSVDFMKSVHLPYKNNFRALLYIRKWNNDALCVIEIDTSQAASQMFE